MQSAGEKLTLKVSGRDDKIRTCDFTHPKGALYQAEPRPDFGTSATQGA